LTEDALWADNVEVWTLDDVLDEVDVRSGLDIFVSLFNVDFHAVGPHMVGAEQYWARLHAEDDAQTVLLD
jgi:hypothetical protein